MKQVVVIGSAPGCVASGHLAQGPALASVWVSVTQLAQSEGQDVG